MLAHRAEGQRLGARTVDKTIATVQGKRPAPLKKVDQGVLYEQKLPPCKFPSKCTVQPREALTR
jgi:hypothetical protein